MALTRLTAKRANHMRPTRLLSSRASSPGSARAHHFCCFSLDQTPVYRDFVRFFFGEDRLTPGTAAVITCFLGSRK
ncbi:unnamed protein product [Knipowitschia caucasica]|uniref:Uncharacterized protein n=1 Tax=Knipowitschia caucasica TaxID=637954 RepID=A0AAV2L637_KNICA